MKALKTENTFTQKVISTIRMIPSGRVATYKQVAAISGKDQASRGVAWILHSCSTRYELPWHRVLSSQGKISFEKGTHNFREQRKRLLKEGVLVDLDGHLDLSTFQWQKKAQKIKRAAKAPKIFSD